MEESEEDPIKYKTQEEHFKKQRKREERKRKKNRIKKQEQVLKDDRLKNVTQEGLKKESQEDRTEAENESSFVFNPQASEFVPTMFPPLFPVANSVSEAASTVPTAKKPARRPKNGLKTPHGRPGWMNLKRNPMAFTEDDFERFLMIQENAQPVSEKVVSDDSNLRVEDGGGDSAHSPQMSEDDRDHESQLEHEAEAEFNSNFQERLQIHVENDDPDPLLTFPVVGQVKLTPIYQLVGYAQEQSPPTPALPSTVQIPASVVNQILADGPKYSGAGLLMPVEEELPQPQEQAFPISIPPQPYPPVHIPGSFQPIASFQQQLPYEQQQPYQQQQPYEQQGPLKTCLMGCSPPQPIFPHRVPNYTMPLHIQVDPPDHPILYQFPPQPQPPPQHQQPRFTTVPNPPAPEGGSSDFVTVHIPNAIVRGKSIPTLIPTIFSRTK